MEKKQTDNKYNKIIGALRQKGVKVTPQRLAIIEILENSCNHPSIEDIYDEVLKKFPSISLATVYNTMDMLEEVNEVVKLKIQDDNKANYEYNLTPHHHFYCKQCKSIYDVNENCDVLTIREINGHRIDESHSYYKGICKDCLDKTDTEC